METHHPHLRLVEPPRPDLYDLIPANDDGEEREALSWSQLGFAVCLGIIVGMLAVCIPAALLAWAIAR